MIARVALKCMSFSKIASLCGYLQVSHQAPVGVAQARWVQFHLYRATNYLPWQPKCFDRAIAGKIMLARRGLKTRLNLGLKREGSKMVAHAWLDHETADDYVRLVQL